MFWGNLAAGLRSRDGWCNRVPLCRGRVVAIVVHRHKVVVVDPESLDTVCCEGAVEINAIKGSEEVAAFGKNLSNDVGPLPAVLGLEDCAAVDFSSGVIAQDKVSWANRGVFWA